MPCSVVKFVVSGGEVSTSMIAKCESLYEASDFVYQQPRTGSYAVIDPENNETWSMAELIGGGFCSLCTKHEHDYWKDWLEGDRRGVTAPNRGGHE